MSIFRLEKMSENCSSGNEGKLKLHNCSNKINNRYVAEAQPEKEAMKADEFPSKSYIHHSFVNTEKEIIKEMLHLVSTLSEQKYLL